MVNKVMIMRKFTNRVYLIIGCLNTFTVLLFVFWIFIDKSIPQSDGANYIDLAFQKINAWENSPGVITFFKSLYFIRDWKPIFFSNFFTFLAFFSKDLQLIVDLFSFLTFLLMQVTIFLMMKRLVDPITATLSASFITLNPYFFNIATQIYADYISILFMIISLLSYYVFLANKSKSTWFLAIFFGSLAIINRPVESLLYLLIFILVLTFVTQNKMSLSIFKSIKLLNYMYVIWNILLFVFVILILKFQIWPALEFGSNLDTFFFLTIIIFIFFFTNYFKFPHNLPNLIAKFFLQVFLICLLWFAPFLGQTWNWIFFTSIGNRFFMSDRSFVELMPIEVLLSIVNNYIPTYLFYFFIFFIPFILLIKFTKHTSKVIFLSLIYVLILLLLSTFSFLYIYSGTGDSRRIMPIFMLLLLFCIYSVYALINKSSAIIFSSVFLALNAFNILGSTFDFDTPFITNNFKLNSIVKSLPSPDPNLAAYATISNLDIPDSTRIAWLTSNSAQNTDEKYVLDPATIRMLFTVDKRSTIFWYTVSPNLTAYYHNLQLEGYEFVLVDASLPIVEPPPSNYFMHSNFRIISEMKLSESIPAGFEFVQSLYINKNKVLLLKVI